MGMFMRRNHGMLREFKKAHHGLFPGSRPERDAVEDRRVFSSDTLKKPMAPPYCASNYFCPLFTYFALMVYAMNMSKYAREGSAFFTSDAMYSGSFDCAASSRAFLSNVTR